MACTNTLNRPIDSFIKYFVGDAKPYHTKILEIVERYVFREAITVSIKETPRITIGLHNKPGCTAVGFGVDYDSECGFDALSCCDLFQCMGGYGLIFDNSDLLESYNITSINGDAGEVTVQGNRVSDTFLNVKSIPTTDTIVIAGNQSVYFDRHELMWVVKKTRAEVISKTANSIVLAGNHTALLNQFRKLECIGSANDDGIHSVINTTFDGTNTTVEVGNEFQIPDLLGYVLIETNSKNNGVYQIESYSIVNGDTHLKLFSGTLAKFTDADISTGYGAVQLRTGLIQNRRIWVSDNSETINNSDWKIVNTVYNVDNDTTTVIIDGTMTTSTGGIANLYGYETAAGFDAPEECSKPNPFTVNASLSERLLIKVIGPEPSPTPSPTITPTLTPSPTPTLTPTPSATSELTPTPTASVTASITPSVTASLTPSVTGTVTPTPSVTASITPTITPTPSMAANIDFDGNDIIDWQDPDTLSGGLISDTPTVVFDGGSI